MLEWPEPKENRVRRCLSILCPFADTGTKQSSTGSSLRPSRQREEFERTARQRVAARHEWLERLKNLVATVKAWADQLDWATRIVDKKMEDAAIGDYKAPALLLQRRQSGCSWSPWREPPLERKALSIFT